MHFSQPVYMLRKDKMYQETLCYPHAQSLLVMEPEATQINTTMWEYMNSTYQQPNYNPYKAGTLGASIL